MTGRSLALFLALFMDGTRSRPVLAQETPRTREEFEQADGRTRKAALARIAQHDLEFPAADNIAVIAASLRDTDPDIRKQALLAVASHAAGPAAFGASSREKLARVRRAWSTERRLIRELRPQVVSALDDPEPRVRQDAVLALGNLDFDGRAEEWPLSQQTAADLAARYPREEHASVRSRIVGALALRPGDSAEIRGVVVDALDDPDADVRNYALMGALRLKLQSALPAAARGLGDPDPGVRLAAAGVFAALGPAASAYEGRLEEASAAEVRAPIRAAIEAALAKVRGQ
jgi:HEAT repeat protein